jgi:hypothetical protein
MSNSPSGKPSPPPPAPEVYAAVVQRRMQWDNLLWQVPALSLTAQAFLFTIALDPSSRRIARVVACLLSLISSILAVHLMTRHRQAEITDSHWLADYEGKHYPPSLAAHGPPWQARRNATSADAWIFSRLARYPGYRVWASGLMLFAVAAIAILVLTLIAPKILEGQ